MLAAGFRQGTRDAAACAFNRLKRSRHGMTTEVLHKVLVLDTVTQREFVSRKRTFHDHFQKIHMRKTATRANHVRKHLFVYLKFIVEGIEQGRSRHRERAAVNGGIAAESRHLYNQQNFRAAQTRFQSGGQTGKAGTHHNNVIHLVKLGLLGSSLSYGSRRSHRSANSSGRNQLTA